MKTCIVEIILSERYMGVDWVPRSKATSCYIMLHLLHGEPGVLRSFVWYDMGSAHSKPKPNWFREIREILSPLTSDII